MVVERQIEVLKLLEKREFESIPRLIRLIGEDLPSEQYAQMRAFLLDVVRNLREGENYLDALALLSAMQVHDKSEEIDNLIHEMYESSPGSFRDAFLGAQEYIADLEDRERTLTEKLREIQLEANTMKQDLGKAAQNVVMAEAQFKSLQQENSALVETIAELKDSNQALLIDKKTLEAQLRNLGKGHDTQAQQNVSLQRENEKLLDRLAEMSERQDVNRRKNTDLGRENTELKRENARLKHENRRAMTEAERVARNNLGRHVLVNFGTGWGYCVAFEGEPRHIERGGFGKLSPENGLLLQTDDTVLYAVQTESARRMTLRFEGMFEKALG